MGRGESYWRMRRNGSFNVSPWRLEMKGGEDAEGLLCIILTHPSCLTYCMIMFV